MNLIKPGAPTSGILSSISTLTLLSLTVFAAFVFTGCGPSTSSNGDRDAKHASDSSTSREDSNTSSEEEFTNKMSVVISGDLNYKGAITNVNSGNFAVDPKGQFAGFGVTGDFDVKDESYTILIGVMSPLDGTTNGQFVPFKSTLQGGSLSGIYGHLYTQKNTPDADGEMPKRITYNQMGHDLCYSTAPEGKQILTTLEIQSAELVGSEKGPMKIYTYHIKGKASYDAASVATTMSPEETIQAIKRKEAGTYPICDPSWVGAKRAHVEATFDIRVSLPDYSEMAEMLGKAHKK